MTSALMNEVGDIDAVSDYAGPHQKLAIKQLLSKAEVAGDTLSGMIPCAEACCEKENEYEIYGGADGHKLFMAYEESSFLCRCCCNPNHELKVHIHHSGGDQQVMMMNRPFRCAGPCPVWGPCCQQESTLHVMPPSMPTGQKFCDEATAEKIIENPQTLMATVKQPICGGLFRPTVEVFQGSAEDNSPFAVVEGPLCCFGGMTEMCFDQNFPISRESGQAGDVGQITKEKPEDAKQAFTELLSDADLFTLEYRAADLTPRQKTALVSAVLLLDFMFFETNQAFECNPIEQSCSIVCCYCYICGAMEPIKCSCDGGDGGGE